MSHVIPAPGLPCFTPLQEFPAGTAVDPQPNGTPIPKVFQPLRIRGVEFQNRIFVSPMCQYSSEDGFVVSPWHMSTLGGIIMRGPGLTFVEATAVLPEGGTTPYDLGIWSDAHAEPLRKLVQFAHSQGQKIGIQLGHAGLKASTLLPWILGNPLATKEAAGGWENDVWGPSTTPFVDNFPHPHELTKEGIDKIVAAFVAAAKRVVDADFDVIEIHGAHGYLLSSFLSPTGNNRTDEYGGSFENRIRLTLEVVDAVREVIPQDMPLFLRISASEWLETFPEVPSWKSEDTVRLAPILAEHGVDLLDVSSGGNNVLQKIRTGIAYQAPFVEGVKKAAGSTILVGLVGALHQGEVAEEVLSKEKADVVFIGRGFLKNPGLVWSIADDLGVETHWVHQTGWRFKGRGLKDLGGDEKSP